MSKVIELLKDLDLKGAVKAWENILQNPQSLNEMTTEDVIELILSTEQNDRAIRRQTALLKASRIPEMVSLGDIIFDKERGNNFTKNINTLCSLNFEERQQPMHLWR